MLNILVTGATGKLGSAVYNRFLEDKKYFVYATAYHKGVDVPPFQYNIDRPNRLYFNFDITNYANPFTGDLKVAMPLDGIGENNFYTATIPQATMVDFLLNRDISCVVHCASLTKPSESYYNQQLYYDTIVKGTENLLQAISEAEKYMNHDIHMIYISSSTVYGINRIPPFKEIDVDISQPYKDISEGVQSPYARYKLQAEQKVYEKKKTTSAILRCFALFNEDVKNIHHSSVLNKFITLALNQYNHPDKKEDYKITINGDGEQTRVFAYIPYIADTIYNLVDMSLGGNWFPNIFNVCPKQDEKLSLNQVIDILEDELNTTLYVERKTDESLRGDMKNVFAENKEVKKYYPINTKPVDELIRMIIRQNIGG